MPNKPKTPTRTIRVNERLWADAKLQAARDGLTLTDVIVGYLFDYTSAIRESREDEQPTMGMEALW